LNVEFSGRGLYFSFQHFSFQLLKHGTHITHHDFDFRFLMRGFTGANERNGDAGTGGWKAALTGRQECLPYERSVYWRTLNRS